MYIYNKKYNILYVIVISFEIKLTIVININESTIFFIYSKFNIKENDS
jgi:hypothetical protein